MVVRIWGLTNSLHGKCLRERRSSVHNGDLLVALSHYRYFPGVHPVPSDLLPPDPTATRLRINIPSG